MLRLLTCVFLFLCLVPGLSAQLLVDFSPSKAGGCSPLVVQLHATVFGSAGGATYAWDLGNGNTSTLASPEAVYTTVGTYTIKLTVTEGGHSASASHAVTVYPAPSAAFTGSASLVCGTPVTFTSQSQGQGGGYIVGWLWDFGDGTTQQAGPAVSHIFASQGTMPVGLTVTDNNGCTASITHPGMVQNLAPLTAAFTPSQQVLCKVTDPEVFTNNSAGPGTITYSWDFGDGSSSTQVNPTHSYAAAGDYSVTLTATSSVGCVVKTTQQSPLNVANYKTDFTVPTGALCQNSTVTFGDLSSPVATSRLWTVDGVWAANWDPLTYAFSSAGTHTVQLANVFGTCPQQVSKQVTINPIPATAPFDVKFQTLCGAPATVNFTDHSPGVGITSWDWHFLYTYGDGATAEYKTSAGPTASHVFTSNDAYTVQLTVTNAAGCSNSVSESFFVNAPSISIYEPSPSPSTSCNQPLTKTLAVYPTSVPVSTYNWDFGDGTTSTAVSPTHTWTQPGVYAAVLHWTDANGCSGTSLNYINVVISNPFTLDFSTNPTTICAGTSLYFTVSGPAVTSNDYYTTTWDFGDNTYISASPQHAYSTPGVYTVKLTGRNTGGCVTTTTKPQYITVLPTPGVYQGYTNTCDGTRNVVTFSYNQAGASSISWDFGDGTATTTAGNAATVQHSYPRTGVYHLNVAGSNGTCSSSNADNVYVLLKQSPVLSGASTVCTTGSLNVSLAIDRDPRETAFGGDYDYTPQFYYGDGTPFTGSVVYTNPGYPYANGAFGWTLTGFQAGKSGLYVVTTSFGFGCTDVSNTIPLTVRGSVTPVLDLQGNGNCYYQPVTLVDASNVGAGNAIVSRTWDFGDGTAATTTASSVSHLYAAPGGYPAHLTVTDAGGCVAGSASIGIAEVSVNGPAAAFSFYSPGRVLEGNTVYFYNNTNTYGSPATVYSWDFGDGTTSTSASPTHVYGVPGTYTVKLTANAGTLGRCASTATQTIVVYYFNSHFQIASGYVTGGTCPPVLAHFTNTSVNYSSVAWDFGDGTTAGNLNTPSHVYTKPGGYQVTLYVYGSGGLTGQYTDSVFVRQPAASLSAAPPAICINQAVNLQAKAHGVLDFLFDFGDGNVSSGPDSGVAHRYTVSGAYTARLVVTDTVGCAAAAGDGVAIQVNPLPTVTISPVDPHVCLGSGITLNASGANTYTWSPGTGLSDALAASPVASPAVNTTYSVMAYDANGCPGQASVNLMVVQPETLNVSPDSTAVCAGDSVRLKAGGTDVYQWIGDVSGLSAVGVGDVVAAPPATAHYAVVGSDAYGCFSDTAAIIVTVKPLPTVNGGGDHEVLDGTPVTLAATGSDDIIYWQWTPADWLSCTDCAQPVCTPKKPTTYTVKVTNGGGCHAADTVSVKLLCIEAHVRIPNAFTPNGDGNNDRFTVWGIGLVDHMVIYDRWGVKVFERSHFYTADADGQWDGSLHGQPAAPGVYVYYVEMSCPSGGGFTRKGTVVLIR